MGAAAKSGVTLIAPQIRRRADNQFPKPLSGDSSPAPQIRIPSIISTSMGCDLRCSSSAHGGRVSEAFTRFGNLAFLARRRKTDRGSPPKELGVRAASLQSSLKEPVSPNALVFM